MRLVVVAMLALAACGRGREPTPTEVPASWRIARLTAGHEIHVGKVACADCHGERFERPPLELCVRCHQVTARLHASTLTPSCLDCHAFRRNGATPWGCARCHANTTHGDAPCAECHEPHQWPGTSHRACTDCHANKQTSHAGLRGCRDCHSIHEGEKVPLAHPEANHPPMGAAAVCERCHAAQHGAIHVDDRALTTGHPSCTSCHLPHSASGFAARACTDCHRDKPVLAPDKHTCAGCHDPHDGGAARPCTSCHEEIVAHPNATKSPLGSCVGCHPPHEIAMAVTCESCHHQPTHATAACLACHTPHGPKPARTTALCAKCHATQTASTAGTGHARCEACHPGDLHGTQPKPPVCATCHAQETASHHTACAQCHQPHAPKTQTICTSCHARTKLAGMHQTAQHGDCARCHHAHEVRPSDDRATCTSCHRDRVDHEPTAVRCATCHPFR